MPVSKLLQGKGLEPTFLREVEPGRGRGPVAPDKVKGLKLVDVEAAGIPGSLVKGGLE